MRRASGCLTVLRKPDGGVHGIVAGDVVRGPEPCSADCNFTVLVRFVNSVLLRVHLPEVPSQVEQCIAHVCAKFTDFVIPRKTICNGSQGMERRLNTGRLVRGHHPEIH